MTSMAEAFDPAFGEAWTRAQCEGMFAHPGVWLILAREEARPAGFALARMIADEAELLLIAVRPALRRRGIGRRLLDNMVAIARERGAARLYLEMRGDNDAEALYLAAGFACVGRRRDYYRGGRGERFDALTLALNLGS
ncbi:MAG: ribosomal protein S18-alanine N-acetyltransferase [Sphingomonadaceae bacterium]|nr:ribosomal protein S18-alanine N-acetyltransferase [Sphingomonadaceae bacterium]